MASAAWRADPAPLVSLTEAVAKFAIAKRDARLKPGALDVSGLEDARATLAASGGFFGFLNSARSAAQAVAARVARDGTDPLAALDAAIAGQAARDRVRSGNALGQAAFGRLWRGEDTDPSAMSALILWRQKHGAGCRRRARRRGALRRCRRAGRRRHGLGGAEGCDRPRPRRRLRHRRPALRRPGRPSWRLGRRSPRRCRCGRAGVARWRRRSGIEPHRRAPAGWPPHARRRRGRLRLRPA